LAITTLIPDGYEELGVVWWFKEGMYYIAFKDTIMVPFFLIKKYLKSCAQLFILNSDNNNKRKINEEKN